MSVSPSSAELHPRGWGSYATLADVLPAIDRALEGHRSPTVPIPPDKDVVLLLIDGLGATLLDAHAAIAPTLASMRTAPIRAGFPATTATSITSLMAGTHCGAHGIIGYSFRTDRAATEGPDPHTLNALRWTLDRSDGASALETYVPEQIQPIGGSLAAMDSRGVEIAYVMPAAYRGSGFSRAAFQAKGLYIGATTPREIVNGVTEALAPRTRRHRFVYAYWPDLDLTGHLAGPGSEPWLQTLQVADQLVADLVTDLPQHAELVVTGDHGMIQADMRFDIDTIDGMLAGVQAVAGEMRAREVYVRTGARDDVLQTWRAILHDDAHVAPREQVLDEQWFGPEVTDVVAERIGDVVAVARGAAILTRTLSEPQLETEMLGHHGAWTAAEQLVPLLVEQG